VYALDEKAHGRSLAGRPFLQKKTASLKQHATCKVLRKKSITSSTAARVGWPGASMRSPVKTECGAFPCAFLPAGLPAQFSPDERGAEDGAQGLETRCLAYGIPFEAITDDIRRPNSRQPPAILVTYFVSRPRAREILSVSPDMLAIV